MRDDEPLEICKARTSDVEAAHVYSVSPVTLTVA